MYLINNLFLCACAVLTAVTAYDYNEGYYGPANYQYEYAVHDPHTGDKKQQYEVRDGDVVKGAYSLADPDGTTRIVEYVAGPHTGFNAVVKKIGHAYHPQHYQQYGYGGLNYEKPVYEGLGYDGTGYGGAGGYGGPGYGGAYSNVAVTRYGYKGYY